jgi:hypothetical protein
MTLLIPVLFFIKASLISPTDSGFYLWQRLTAFWSVIFSIEHWGEMLINSFVPMSLVPLAFYQETLKFFKENRYFLILFLSCLGTTLFAGSSERLMIPAAIPFYLLIGTIFEKWGEPRDWKVWGIFLLSFICLFHYNMGVFRHPEKIVTIITYIGSTIAVAGLSLLIRNEKRPFKVNSIMLRS